MSSSKTVPVWMRVVLVIFFVAATGLYRPAISDAYTSPPSPAWAKRHSEPAQGDDGANSAAVDPWGNTCVTGSSEGAFATVKYDPNGNQLWVVRYNGAGGESGGANALALDDAGSVYVTGSFRDGTGSDIVTVKVDSEGSQVWTDRYSASEEGTEEPRGIAVDSMGNAYVTAESDVEEPDSDNVIIKYAPDGALLWEVRFGFWIRSMCVDALGNVHVAGGSNDILVVKTDADGQELWSVSYDGPRGLTDLPYFLTVDQAGNVYVTGKSHGREGEDNTDADFVTIKYGPQGNELWVSRYTGPGDNNDYARHLAVDAPGNTYVTGPSRGTTTSNDYATIKYDSAGNELWAVRYDGPSHGPDSSYRVAVDSGANVYVTGVSDDSWGAIATVKYDPSGNELWVAREDITCMGLAGLHLGPSGHVVVSGTIKDRYSAGGYPITTDYGTFTYDAAGNRLWAVRYDHPREGRDEMRAMAVDPSGNAIVAGSTEVGNPYDTDALTAAYSPTGSLLWVARYNGPDNVGDALEAVAADPFGNVIVAGWTEYDFVTIKYDLGGNELWVARYDGPGASSDAAAAVVTDALGNIYVTGRSRGDYPEIIRLQDRRDYATVKYDPNGNELWVARYNGPAGQEDVPEAIAVDSSGHVYVTGYSKGEGTDFDYATIKYDPDGNELWVARHEGSGNDGDFGRALAVDASGNVHVTGSTVSLGTGSDFGTIKYDPNGNELWVARFARADGPEEPVALALDALGNVYVTGESDFDYVTVKYSTDGDPLWTSAYEFGTNHPADMAIDDSGNVYVTGTSWSGGSSYDFCTVKVDPLGTEVWVVRYPAMSDSDGTVAVELGPAGDFYVAGTSLGVDTEEDFLTIKYVPSMTSWGIAATTDATVSGTALPETSGIVCCILGLILPASFLIFWIGLRRDKGLTKMKRFLPGLFLGPTLLLVSPSNAHAYDWRNILLYDGSKTVVLSHHEYRGDIHPRISNNGYVAWIGLGTGSCEDNHILLYDGTTSMTLSQGLGCSENHDVNDMGVVVWNARHGTTDLDRDIFLYNGANTTNISNKAGYDLRPKINDQGMVVWEGGEDEGSSYDIYEIFFYDGTAVTQITHNDYDDGYPEIDNNGRIAWCGRPDDADWEIFLYDGIAIAQITDNDHHDLDPKLNDDGLLVWKGLDSSGWEIFLYDGAGTTRITDNDYDDSGPVINRSGEIAWSGRVDNADKEILLYDGGTITQITDNDYDDSGQQINDNGQIVWHGNAGPSPEIFLYDGGATTRLTDYDWLDENPDINDAGVVVWTRYQPPFGLLWIPATVSGREAASNPRSLNYVLAVVLPIGVILLMRRRRKTL